MRKSIIIIALVSVALFCLWTIFDKNEQTSFRDISRFAVENPEEISLIKMKDRQGNEVILSKKDGDWFVNDKLKAFKPKIESLLNETIKNIKITDFRKCGLSKQKILYINNIADFFLCGVFRNLIIGSR